MAGQVADNWLEGMSPKRRRLMTKPLEKVTPMDQLWAIKELIKAKAVDGCFVGKLNPLEICLTISIVLDNSAPTASRSACISLLDLCVPNWRRALKGRADMALISRRDTRVYQWRKFVMDRDGHKCVECGSIDRLEAHHIIHWKDAPELRIDVGNGITLCHACHMSEHQIRG